MSSSPFKKIKNTTFTLLFFVGTWGFCQQKMVKEITSSLQTAEVFLSDIDQITIKNTSKSDTFEIALTEDDSRFYTVKTIQDKVLAIKVKSQTPQKPMYQGNKYCVTLPYYTECTIGIPKGKEIILFAQNIDVFSSNFQGDMAIYINKGDLKIKHPKGNTTIKLFAGTVYGTLPNENIKIQTNKGKIIFNGKKEKSPFTVTDDNFIQKFVVSSINANLIISH